MLSQGPESPYHGGVTIFYWVGQLNASGTYLVPEASWRSVFISNKQEFSSICAFFGHIILKSEYNRKLPKQKKKSFSFHCWRACGGNGGTQTEPPPQIYAWIIIVGETSMVKRPSVAEVYNSLHRHTWFGHQKIVDTGRYSKNRIGKVYIFWTARNSWITSN